MGQGAKARWAKMDQRTKGNTDGANEINITLNGIDGLEIVNVPFAELIIQLNTGTPPKSNPFVSFNSAILIS